MVGLMLLVFELSCCFSGAYGTSTFLLSGSGVDCCFPNMPFSAFPPYPLVTSRRYHFRGQTAVQRAVPLRGDFRMKRSKIIETSQNTTPCAVRKARILHDPCGNNGLPFMAKCASPPNPLVAEGGYLIRLQAAIALCVPFCGEARKACCQIILTGHHGFSKANRTSCTSASAQDACPPRMAFITFPPDASFASCQHISGV